MLNFSRIRGAGLHARDGVVGRLDDLYFDDVFWQVRYVIIDTGGWLTGRKVLIAPATIGPFDAARYGFSTSLTRDQVANSPAIDTQKPVSRQQEVRLHDYYGWSPYWGEGLLQGDSETGEPRHGDAFWQSHETQASIAEARAMRTGDPHLRSARAVASHRIAAVDGDIGHVEDFLIEEANWIIRYLIVDTRNWLPGKNVVISPRWVDAVDWPNRRVRVDLTRDQIREGPAYDPNRNLVRSDEEYLFAFYGRAPYW